MWKSERLQTRGARRSTGWQRSVETLRASESRFFVSYCVPSKTTVSVKVAGARMEMIAQAFAAVIPRLRIAAISVVAMLKAVVMCIASGRE